MIQQFHFSPDNEDRWKWASGSDGVFSTSILTSQINGKLLNTSTNCVVTLRNKLVPKKVEVFVWRARRKRLPVPLELDKRGVDLHSVRCPICDDDLESVDHSLVLCSRAFEIWSKVFNWWGMNNLNNLSVGEIFSEDPNQQMSSVGVGIWQAVTWICGYLIWSNRNKKVFKNKIWDTSVALNEIQVKSFDWIAKRCKMKKLEWHIWLASPHLYLQ
ncbi:uncharacterized protein [Rutidosis leptorrhynchoides]|uniref:uncharacterized protein n=1 Tax=Rutidosis leptorrhynchoides TaxID=125765 RepID=UPI003A99DA63